mgnify:CR=1 FL=1
MILVADSGATKTDWAAIAENGTCTHLSSMGLNPNYITDPTLLDSEIGNVAENSGNADTVRQIFFYGAGCSSDENREKISHLLQKHFPNAKTEVHTDLLGACRAVCGTSDGLVGILGTGSNSCVYQNCRISQNIPSAGYMLGDEGSGTYIGKQLVKQYLTEFLPKDLQQKFEEECHVSRGGIMDTIYRQPCPNKFFASLMPFVLNHRHEPFVRSITDSCFDDFFQNQILKYRTPLRQIHLVGSVAFLFGPDILEMAMSYGYYIGSVLQAPIYGLEKYHSPKN